MRGKAIVTMLGLACSMVSSVALGALSFEANYNTNQNLTVGTPSAGTLQGSASVSGGNLNLSSTGNNGVTYGPAATNYFNVTDNASWGSNTVVSIFTLDSLTPQALLSVATEDPYQHLPWTGQWGMSLFSNLEQGLPALQLVSNWGSGGLSSFRVPSWGKTVQTGVEYFLAGSWRDNGDGTLNMTIYLRETSDLTGANAGFYSYTSTNPGDPQHWSDSTTKVAVGYYANGANNAYKTDGDINLIQIYGGDFNGSRASYETLFTNVPEPVTMTLMGLGAFLTLRRKK